MMNGSSRDESYINHATLLLVEDILGGPIRTEHERDTVTVGVELTIAKVHKTKASGTSLAASSGST